LGGFQYSYVNAATLGLADHDAPPGVGELRIENYTVITGTSATAEILLSEQAGEIQAGQTVTIIFGLESDLRIGRSSQFKLTTANGNVFVGTVSVGQQSG